MVEIVILFIHLLGAISLIVVDLIDDIKMSKKFNLKKGGGKND